MALKKRELLVKISLFFFLGVLRSTQGRECSKEVKKQPPYLKEASSFSSMAGEEYDYIIVGGGTAGCPLAATLSQNHSVLLLERGGSPYGNLNISYMQNFHICLTDTSPNSPSQPFISSDGVINTRARVLGGGTCINAGFYTRASSSFVEAVGWDSELVNESYPWVERRIVNWPDVAPWQAALRDGLLEAGVAPFNGYTYDHLYGTKIGGIIFAKDGFRRTAADLLAAGNPGNLRVLLHATVQRILFRKLAGGRPKAVGVQFKDENGRQHRALLKNARHREVILSSGAIGSPQLLLLSGIGPKKDLEKMRIPLVLHNQHVGKGMADNPLNSIFMPTKKPVRQSLIQTVGITKPGVFIEASSGFGQSSDSIRCHHGIMSAEIGQLSTIPPKQRSLEAARKYAREKKNLPKEAFRGGFVLAKIDGPLSTGHLSLLDTDVDSNPSVTFNYFSHPRDLRRCVYGIKSIAQVVRTKRFAELTVDDAYTMEMLLNMSVQANVNMIPKHTNDTASIEQFCRDTVTTIWHYHGGCHVGKVVDDQYRVLGVSGLRVIDGSTFDRSPGTNPQATVMMMGRYMGVKILRKRLGREAGQM
ncbi:protein HOTHEAD-like isoform X1 [Canna indica]|uniref:Protein HOTHEAD-like isoform X1 n=1 Tax=Canna indica TaxID=4628 RepID=A0AAQ3JKS7_9LILI|nr:protein HOTHEAD-like isoform X1 [Canna indica]